MTKDEVTSAIAANALAIKDLSDEVKVKQSALQKRQKAQSAFNTLLDAFSEAGQEEATDEGVKLASAFAGTALTDEEISMMNEIILESAPAIEAPTG